MKTCTSWIRHGRTTEQRRMSAKQLVLSRWADAQAERRTSRYGERAQRSETARVLGIENLGGNTRYRPVSVSVLDAFPVYEKSMERMP